MLSHARPVEKARHALAGHTIGYEDFVAEPGHGLGDASDTVLTGRIQPGRAGRLDALESSELKDLVRAWGFPEA